MNNYNFNQYITELNIPYGTIEIPERAYYNCTNLKRVILPDTVTKIGKWAFCGCSSLEYIDLGNGIREIQEYAFSGCSALKILKIPETCVSLGSEVVSQYRPLSGIGRNVASICPKCPNLYVIAPRRFDPGYYDTSNASSVLIAAPGREREFLQYKRKVKIGNIEDKFYSIWYPLIAIGRVIFYILIIIAIIAFLSDVWNNA